jgi:isoquinoline 1-oxidoreductase subunit beta
VQLAYSRETDFQADYFRPPSIHRLRGQVDGQGKLSYLQHDAAAASVLAWYAGTSHSETEKDGLSFAGVSENLYACRDFLARGRAFKTAIRCGIWRSIGHFSSSFANECFVDELAAHAGIDALAFRLNHLSHQPRTKAVLERVAEQSGWRQARPNHVKLGLALYRQFFPKEDGAGDFEVIVAHVARLEREANSWRLARIDAVIDCGIVVHQGLVKAQIEGAAAWALSALSQAIRIDRGQPKETNFHQYSPVRMSKMPQIVVSIVESDAWPAGVGEKGVPGVVPAVLNAWYAASGERVRTLPWKDNPLGL